jgi:flagellar motor switch protein FliG
MDQKNQENGIFINGKKQVIELLQRMESKEKSKLLKNLKLRNPSLARELTEQCLCFDSIWELTDQDLRIVLNNVQPAIIGLALNTTQTKNQKRALSLMSRDKAVTAFEILQKDLSGNQQQCLRAQQKILEMALNLHQNRVIQFN